MFLNSNIFSLMLLKFIYSEKATKFCEIVPLLLTVGTVVKSKGTIPQNFVAFSEYINFMFFEKKINRLNIEAFLGPFSLFFAKVYIISSPSFASEYLTFVNVLFYLLHIYIKL